MKDNPNTAIDYDGQYGPDMPDDGPDAGDVLDEDIDDEDNE